MAKTTEQRSLPRDLAIGVGVTLVEATEDKVILGIDRRGELGISKSGKSTVLARFSGGIPGTDLGLNLTLYRKHGNNAKPKHRGSAPIEGGSTTGQEKRA